MQNSSFQVVRLARSQGITNSLLFGPSPADVTVWPVWSWMILEDFNKGVIVLNAYQIQMSNNH